MVPGKGEKQRNNKNPTPWLVFSHKQKANVPTVRKRFRQKKEKFPKKEGSD